MAAIELTEVGKTYPGAARESVCGVSLSVADGQFVVLVGPSGCGKSTLLRMVAGLETVTRGTIRIGERPVNEVEPAERDIAMVFQNYALYPHMSVRDNLSYGLRNRGIAKPEIARRIEAVAQTLQIGDFLDRKPKALSGGQRQRVAMGRAMVREPAAFLFDEPLSNLDAKLRVQMRAEIRALQKRLRTTSLYVTHDQLEAMTLADKLVVLNHGHVEQAGTPLEVYETPASLFVAGFIGSPAMNLVPVESVHPEGEAPGLTLGMRPEHLRLADSPAQEGIVLPLEVTAVELVGAESYVYGRLERGGEDIVVRAPAHARPALGARIWAVGDPARAHLFDTPSGRRIGPANAADGPFAETGGHAAAHSAPLRQFAKGA